MKTTLFEIHCLKLHETSILQFIMTDSWTYELTSDWLFVHEGLHINWKQEAASTIRDNVTAITWNNSERALWPSVSGSRKAPQVRYVTDIIKFAKFSKQFHIKVLAFQSKSWPFPSFIFNCLRAAVDHGTFHPELSTTSRFRNIIVMSPVSSHVDFLVI